MKTLENLFVNQLKEVYNAEKKICNYSIHITPEIHSADLQSLNTGLKNSCSLNIANLENAFKFLGIGSFKKKPRAVEGIIEESNVLLKWNAPPAVIDVAVILSYKKLVHILLSIYSNLKIISRQLEFFEINHLMIENLDRSNYLNSVLNSLALQINRSADEILEERED